MNLRRFSAALRTSRLAAEQELLALERAYLRLLAQAGRDAATALIASTERGALTAATAETPDWQPPPEGELLEPAALADLTAARLRKTHARIVKQVAGGPLERMGIAWDITHPLSQALLDAAGQRTGERLAQGAGDVIRETVAGAYLDGLPVRDTAALIRAKLGEAAPGQAKMLARTDLNSLANGGSVMAAQMVGAATKTWLTAEDDRVREMHVEADGQTVPIDQPFDVCGEQLDYPGDPAGSDDCVCNCRCTVIYGEAIEGEAASAAPQERVPSRGFMALGKALAHASAGATGARIPAKGFAAATTIVVDALPAAPAAWVSDLAFEGAATEDGRYILPGALSWRELPLSLGVIYDTPHADMVMAAPVCGRIDRMEFADTNMDGEPLVAGVRAVRGYGEFDTAGDDGAEVARMVGDETMRGVSVDLAVDDWCYRDPETGELIEPDDVSDAEMERAFFGELQYAVRAGTIMAATVCPTPAFADARIALVADGRRVLRMWAPLRILMATLNASAAPVAPQTEWFYRQEPDRLTPLTYEDSGEVYGHIAGWESCHTGRAGVCFKPPRSPSGYAYFNLGEIRCADGGRVSCGQIFFHGEHAPMTMTAQRVHDHYAHSGLVGADVRAIDGRHGIWVSGALRSSLTPEQAREFMAAKPSGDWRQMRPGGSLELTAVLAVNDPGYPVPRGVVASADDADGEPLALVAEFALAEDESLGRIPAHGFATA